jgi:hypothetical protein
VIDWLVNRIFKWDTLRDAVFDEVHMYDHLHGIMNDEDAMKTASLSWMEGDTWYGWTHNESNNRYYFDDIGNKSLIGLWEDQWLRKADNCEV